MAQSSTILPTKEQLDRLEMEYPLDAFRSSYFGRYGLTYRVEVYPVHKRKSKKAYGLGKSPSSVVTSLSRADALGIPREISIPFLSKVEMWKVSTGSESLVKRLKSIKLDFIRVKAGMKMCAPWVAKNKNHSSFRGPLKGLHTWAKQSSKNFSRAIQLLMCYTLEVAPHLLPSQEEKFLRSVEAPNPPIPIDILLGISQSVEALNPSRTLCRPKSLTTILPKPSKREPDPYGKSHPEGSLTLQIAKEWFFTLGGRYNKGFEGYTSFHGPFLKTWSERNAKDRVKPKEGTPAHCNNYTNASVGNLTKAKNEPLAEVRPSPKDTGHDPKVFPLYALCNQVLRDFEGPRSSSFPSIGYSYNPSEGDFPVPHPSEFCIGKIGLIQEPGLKLRAVANPSRLVQAALQPMKDFLYGCLKLLPWDCTHKQEKAFPFIQEALAAGTTVHSVDLSDASSYFPLDLQKVVLDKLFPKDKQGVDAFIYASKSPFVYTGTSGIPRYISWTRGQPLGLGPSFASAFLTHGLLLLYLNGYQHLNKFFVLGDDVVILDDDLHVKYRETLSRLNCPVAEEKCLSSDVLAEFAGKIILKDMIIPQIKWRQPSDNSFIDFVRNIGIKALYLLPHRQRKMAEKILNVPSEYGGIGFNPKGIPLAERVFQAYLLMRESCNSYLMSYNRLLQKLTFEQKGGAYGTIESPLMYNGDYDFDKKSIAYVEQYLPNFWKFFDILGQNLFSLDPNLPLSMEGQGQHHRTVLEILEAKYE